jgi:hypothetical protein
MDAASMSPGIALTTQLESPRVVLSTIIELEKSHGG